MGELSKEEIEELVRENYKDAEKLIEDFARALYIINIVREKIENKEIEDENLKDMIGKFLYEGTGGSIKWEN